ncbi:MAG: flavodoxin family protein [Desulfobaccales bacterium]
MKVLIAYDSRTGHTERMAKYMAEGVRFSGCDVETKKITECKNEADIKGYDGYILGCPTYHRDMTQTMKTFLFLAQKADLRGKVGGAFGSYTHSGDAPKYIYDTMQYVFHMNMTDMGSFNLKEGMMDKSEGIKACQDYGKVVAEKLSAA